MAKSFTAWEFLAEIYGGDLPPAASERRYSHKEWQPAIDALAEDRYFAKGRASISAVPTEIVAHLWRQGGLWIDPYIDTATNGAPYTFTGVRFYQRPEAADRPLPRITRAELFQAVVTDCPWNHATHGSEVDWLRKRLRNYSYVRIKYGTGKVRPCFYIG